MIKAERPLWIRPEGEGTLYERLHRALRRAVLDARLVPGARLPSTRSLARELGISRTTTSAVYDQLLAEGYFEARPGSGTFVAAELTAPPRHEAPTPRAPRAPRLSPWSARLIERNLGYPHDDLLERPRARYEFMYGIVDAASFPGAEWRRIVGRLLRRPRGRHVGYAPPEGAAELRRAIADHLARARGVRCEPDQVLITSGAQQALSLVTRTLVARGERALIEEPHYVGARRVLAAEGADLVGVPVDDEGMNLARISGRRLSGARLAVVTPSHQFPTGAVMSLPRRLELLDWARRADAFVVEDDYDSEFRYHGRPVESLHALDDDERVIYVGTFSKTLAPALRMGFVIAPRGLTRALRAAKWLADWSTPTLEQQVLAELLSEGHFDRHLRRVRARYARRRQALIDALARELEGEVSVTGAAAGLHLLAWLPRVALCDLSRLVDEARRQSVGVHPVSPFYLGQPPASGLVFGYTRLSEGEIAEGIRRLALALRSAGNRSR